MFDPLKYYQAAIILYYPFCRVRLFSDPEGGPQLDLPNLA